jgi:hypothetical protein
MSAIAALPIRIFPLSLHILWGPGIFQVRAGFVVSNITLGEAERRTKDSKG